MSRLIPFVPLIAAGVLGWLLFRVNRPRRWFTPGELIFWTVILLAILQLIWLIWF